MQTRKFDEMISYFNRKVSDMYIDRKYKMELLAMITAIGMAHEKELDAQLERRWIPCSERLPEEGREVLGTDTYGCVRHVIKDKCGENEFATYEEMMHIPIIAWTLLPDPYKRGEKND